MILACELRHQPRRSDGPTRTHAPAHGRGRFEAVPVLIEGNASIREGQDLDPSERVRVLNRKSGIHSATPELGVLMLQAPPAELDRVGLGLTEGEGDPSSQQPAGPRREGNHDLAV